MPSWCVAAPIAGQLTLELPHKGDFIDQPRALPLIEARAPDHRHLLHLQSQHAMAKERADLARKQLSELDAADRELADRTTIHRGGVVARLGYEIEEARAEKAGCFGRAPVLRRDVGTRMEQLVKTGTATAIKSAEALATLEATSARCEVGDAKLKRLDVELKPRKAASSSATASMMRPTRNNSATACCCAARTSKFVRSRRRCSLAGRSRGSRRSAAGWRG